MAKRFTKAVFFFFSVLFAFLCFPASVNAEAGEKEYSGVIEDLSKDENFNKDYYTANANDYSLNVIQLAESSDNELFVYVYQPSGGTKNLVASSINLSIKQYVEISPRNYSLTLLDSEDTLFKYLVNDFVITKDSTRYYAITSVYRKWDKDIDTPATGGNTIDEVEYEVAKRWTFGTVNGKPFCGVIDFDTIVVTDKFVGYIRYTGGYSFLGFYSACDSHFVAFDTDKPIEKLYEAEVSFVTQSYTQSIIPIVGTKKYYGEVSAPQIVKLNSSDPLVTYRGSGFLAGTYEWKRIQTVDSFLSEAESSKTKIYSGAFIDVSSGVELTDSAKTELQDKKWILRFYESPYTSEPTGTTTSWYSTIVSNVTIIRLKFETDGISYNLGVVDNKQTGSLDPAGETYTNVEAKDWLKETWKWLKIILAVVLLILACVLFTPLFKIIGKGLSALFKWLKNLVNKKSKRK